MATATLYLYEDPNQTYSISCWADRSFSRGPATISKTANIASTSYPFTTITAGSITTGSLTSMPSSNLQNLVFSYAKASNYKINISAATLYVTLASDTSFESISVGNQLYSYPTYNTQYSGAVDLSGVNTTEKTITATLKIDPQMSTTVLQALGGGNSWSIFKEATITEDVFQFQDTAHTYIFKRYYQAASGIQRSWCSAKVTNVYLVIEYEEDTSVIVDRSTAISMLNVGVSGVAKKIGDMFVGVNGVAKKISEAWIGVNGIAKKIYPAYLISMLNPGDIVQIDEDGLGGYKDWMVVHHNYYGANQTLLMRKYCLADKKALNYSGGNTSTYGYPYFNGTADNYLKDTWLVARPDSFQNLLIETTIIGRTWSGGTNKTAERKIWLPPAAGISPDFYAEGQGVNSEAPAGPYAYFINNNTNEARIAYAENDTSAAIQWWTRTTVGGVHPQCKTIGTNGTFYSRSYAENCYLRPVINVYSNNYLEKVSDGVYRMIGGGKQTGAILITFTIEGTSCQAENGMTWEEWIASNYNTIGVTAGNTSSTEVMLGGRRIDAALSATIIAGKNYELFAAEPE